MHARWTLGIAASLILTTMRNKFKCFYEWKHTKHDIWNFTDYSKINMTYKVMQLNRLN